MNAHAQTGGRVTSTAPAYLCRRVLDAFLREDIRSCVSRGRVFSGSETPFASSLAPDLLEGLWLRMGDLGLWLAVEPCQFMQDWRVRALPAVWIAGQDAVALHSLAEILERFRDGLDEESRSLHAAFAEECLLAQEHGALCDAERARSFSSPVEAAADWPAWARSLLRHDRLASFHDHPFYPTARAKLGFSAADLRAYAPEFQPVFALRWLAVPRALYDGGELPGDIRPSFADVGLDEEQGRDRVLLPVHPALWDKGLDVFLAESGLASSVVKAPAPRLEVTPTLSVRTVAPLACPAQHIKLPLAMRTLGARNLRTIKPSTIADGAAMQKILAAIVADTPELASRLLLTDEDVGATVAGQTFLGFILRRYPSSLRDEEVAPVAALAAPAADGRLVVEELAERFYGGDLTALFDDYLDLTLRLHLTLWVRYGVALESNQQNSLVVFSSTEPLRLLLKDNDAARVHGRALSARRPDLAHRIDAIRDARIIVADETPLAQMFITITLQLNIAVLVEALADVGRADREALYERLSRAVAKVLDRLAAEGDDVALARRALLEADRLPLKLLLRAATLESKAQTGSTDVNKFYGATAPNFSRRP
ncbi:IucA/IucC family protein [Methylosinus sp. Ce-a6]|uniref:IucA/IucC family protein n=1 Tax=Methylosinus sp. Ce-a6 TaxID=2172005 RepID=UPI001357C052|nr:IucA/IucC family protein [Methylosinus sp. Ce-a6]